MFKSSTSPNPNPSPSATAPIAAVKLHTVVSPHGERNDPYYWLRDDERKNKEVLTYLAAENAYEEQQLGNIKGLENQLFDEITARLKQDDASVPYHRNGYWYYTRFTTGKEYPIHARRRGTLDAPEQILLDANELAQGHEFYQIATLSVSPNADWLAFCEDSVGRRQYRLRFKNLITGKLQRDCINDVEADIAWANDNQTILYVEKDPETLLGLTVKKHLLGQDPTLDTIIFQQTDTSFYTGVSKSKDERFIFLTMENTLSSEWRYADAGDTHFNFKVFQTQERDHEYQIEALHDQFIIRTNWQAKNFRLMTVRAGQESDRKQWRDLVAHRPDTFIQDFEVFNTFLALSVRSGGLKKISVKILNNAAEFFIASDEAAYSMSLSANPEMDTEVLRYAYSSLTTPTTIYDYSLQSGTKKLLKSDPVMGTFDPADYRTEFLFAPARDAQLIPVSIVYHKNFRRDASAPMLQYAYGSYGLSMDPVFSSARLSLLDRGFIFVIAHVRGGQEMGREWYDQGRLLHKKNTFTDFVDVTRYLVANRYAAKASIFAMGGSAGGLLMGVIANISPQDYCGIVAQVPFVDVLTTMLDESIPLTTNEYDEWGNPDDQETYDYLLSYSPYDNVRAQAYPAILVTTGLWDSQVQYYEPAKWVAKLRALKTDQNPLILHVDMEAGHGGKSGRFQRYRIIAKEYAFMLGLLGALSDRATSPEDPTHPTTPAVLHPPLPALKILGH